MLRRTVADVATARRMTVGMATAGTPPNAATTSGSAADTSLGRIHARVTVFVT